VTSAIEKVCVIGLGYVGLPTAAVIAGRGMTVLGVDTNGDTVSCVNRGEIPLVEPYLDVMVKHAVAAGSLTAATEAAPADAFIVAVPTPFAGDHEPDLSYIRTAVTGMAPHLATGNLVVIESTSPVGTTDAVAAWLGELRPDLAFPPTAGDAADVNVAHSPERVLPGQVLRELVGNDRVVGGLSSTCTQRAVDFYRRFVDGDCVPTTARTAELVKLAENAYRDVNIAFANELSLVCDKLDIDVWDVVDLANRHPRVQVLRPGPGVGGHCIAVDPWFIVDSAPDETPLIQAARAVNDGKPAHVAARIEAAAAAIDKPCIACLGLAYKADTDDLRESPSVDVARALVRDGRRLLVVEPNVTDLPADLASAPDVMHVGLDQALAEANVIVLLTDHKDFREVDAGRLAGKQVIDTRGLWR
jgi:UDP-N-acetyl-D-mannosaminuronic acid dehydrogenase